MKKLILHLCLFLAPIIAINAQNELSQTGNKITIQGSVLDINGTPIKSAIILIDGERTDIKTDEDGSYIIKVKKKAKRIGIAALGTGVYEEDIEGRTQIDFVFNNELADLPDFEAEENIDPGEVIVNTGYSFIKRKYLAGDVGFLDVEHSKKKYNSILQILMDTPGIVFLNGGIYVTGAVRNFLGFIPPLYIVDSTPCYNGIPLTASDVASVTVLKGASAAVYGSRGMGGVIIFTSKDL